jgi:heme exporter protein C
MDIKRNWWKVLSVILMLYVIIAGILIPIKPGILDYDNNKATIGQQYDVKITTYNTHFDEAQDINVYILLPSDQLLPAVSHEVINAARLSASFNIPSNIAMDNNERMDCSLVIDNEVDGYMQYPEAVTIKPSETRNLSLSNIELVPLTDLKNVDDFKFPFRPIVYETIRNTFFHVAIWMAMFLILIVSCYHSISYLISNNLIHDQKSSALTSVALIFGIAGLLTGSMWARFTWGTWWTNDVKLNMTSIALLIYCSYWILRSSLSDIDTRARLSSVFNLFSFVALFILVMVIPRLTDSLHPGNGGNPAFGDEDLDNTLRTIFYPAIIAYALIGFWIAQLTVRYHDARENIELMTFNNSN